jgi:hypothetical protein
MLTQAAVVGVAVVPLEMERAAPSRQIPLAVPGALAALAAVETYKAVAVVVAAAAATAQSSPPTRTTPLR